MTGFSNHLQNRKCLACKITRKYITLVKGDFLIRLVFEEFEEYDMFPIQQLILHCYLKMQKFSIQNV